jgi:hypothetical protein
MVKKYIGINGDCVSMHHVVGAVRVRF